MRSSDHECEFNYNIWIGVKLPTRDTIVILVSKRVLRLLNVMEYPTSIDRVVQLPSFDPSSYYHII